MRTSLMGFTGRSPHSEHEFATRVLNYSLLGRLMYVLCLVTYMSSCHGIENGTTMPLGERMATVRPLQLDEGSQFLVLR